VGPEPAEHRFDLGSGITENALGETVDERVSVRVTKTGHWSGKLDATLYADDEVVDCANYSRADGDSIHAELEHLTRTRRHTQANGLLGLPVNWLENLSRSVDAGSRAHCAIARAAATKEPNTVEASLDLIG
jgi:hypothetical protein